MSAPQKDREPEREQPGRQPEHGQSRDRKKARRLYRLLGTLVVLGVVVGVVLRAPSALRDFTIAFSHLRAGRLYWLAAAIGAEFVSFVFYAAIQRVLFLAARERVRLPVLLRLSIASSGLRALLPAGVVPSSGWLYGEYRQLGITGPISLFVVLASGFVSTVCLLGLLLVGAAIAGVGGAAVLAPTGAVLVVGSAGFLALVHRLPLCERVVGDRRGWWARLARRSLHLAAGVARIEPGWRQGALSFAASAANWLADLVCLIAAFVLLNIQLPWSGLLFAYCAAQLAGSIVPLPGGLGAVEGGLVGAFDLTGVPAGSALAVAVVYRVITYWGVAILGLLELLLLARHPPSPDDVERIGEDGRVVHDQDAGDAVGAGDAVDRRHAEDARRRSAPLQEVDRSD